jgi:diguanylate cyclase (GGDEF)-like protein
MSVDAEQAAVDGRLQATSPVAAMRRLAAIAERAGDPDRVRRAMVSELMGLAGAEEVILHHLRKGDHDRGELDRGDLDRGDLDLYELVVYLFDGEGRLSYLCPRAERPAAVSWVASTGRSFLATGERELQASVARLCKDASAVRCALLAPLVMRGEIEAVVVLISRQQGRFAGERCQQACTLIEQAATALALVQARVEAGTDAVTGCMNHRAMRRRLQEEVARAQRTGSPLACLLIDLDDFKLVNDRHGHGAGDAVLKGVAHTLMGEFRAFDRVARYGGDEFVVILPETDLGQAAVAAERAIDRLASLSIAGADAGTGAGADAGTGAGAGAGADAGAGTSTGADAGASVIGASIGVAQWRASMGVDDLLASCDGALFEGKRAGKRRVAVAR